VIRLLCPSPKSFSVRARLEANRALQAHFIAMDQDRFDRVAPDYDAVMVRFNTRVGANVMGEKSRLKAILSPTTGLDHIDLAVARRRGVRVFHLRDQGGLLRRINPTAELTIALMLALLRRLPAAMESVKAGRWQAADFLGREAADKTIGIVGYGRLGRKVARTARALDMKVIACDTRDVTMPRLVERCVNLDNLLQRADVVSIHVPLNDSTCGLIGRKEIARMKPGAVLINTARGAIVDDTALLAALRTGHLGGAAVDVLDGEHRLESGGHPMIDYARKHGNLLITPHVGGATEESIEKTDMNVLERYLQWAGITGR